MTFKKEDNLFNLNFSSMYDVGMNMTSGHLLMNEIFNFLISQWF